MIFWEFIHNAITVREYTISTATPEYFIVNLIWTRINVRLWCASEFISQYEKRSAMKKKRIGA